MTSTLGLYAVRCFYSLYVYNLDGFISFKQSVIHSGKIARLRHKHCRRYLDEDMKFPK